MTTIISLSNHKGGVGKTTSAVNIGAGLAKAGKRVLLVDLDPQANMTQCLGLEGRTPTIYDAIHNTKLKPIEITERLHAVPSTLDLSGAETELIGEAGREHVLSEILEPFQNVYDYILIDTPPSLGLLTVNALTASDAVYIPLQAQYLAMNGVSKMLEAIEKIQRRVNKKLKLGGIIVTQYDQRRTLDKEIAEAIRKRFKDIVFQTNIRVNVELSEAQLQGTPVNDYKPNSNGAQDYGALCAEIIKRTSTQKKKLTPKKKV